MRNKDAILGFTLFSYLELIKEQGLEPWRINEMASYNNFGLALWRSTKTD